MPDDRGFTGLEELIQRLDQLPPAVSQRALNNWTTIQANRLAARMRTAVAAWPFKASTRKTAGGIRGARVRPAKARALFGAMARAIAFGSRRHGAPHWSILNRGTRPRVLKGLGKYPAGTRRGSGPALRIAATIGPGILAQIKDQAVRDLDRVIQRALRKHGGSAP